MKKVKDEDANILAQIERDVERLHPSLHFFNDEIEAIPKRIDMTEALFVFAKLNPGLCYVQGMHELLARYILFALITRIKTASQKMPNRIPFGCSSN